MEQPDACTVLQQQGSVSGSVPDFVGFARRSPFPFRNERTRPSAHRAASREPPAPTPVSCASGGGVREGLRQQLTHTRRSAGECGDCRETCKGQRYSCVQYAVRMRAAAVLRGAGTATYVKSGLGTIPPLWLFRRSVRAIRRSEHIQFSCSRSRSHPIPPIRCDAMRCDTKTPKKQKTRAGQFQSLAPLRFALHHLHRFALTSVAW